MSNIPTSAMPRAGHIEGEDKGDQTSNSQNAAGQGSAGADSASGNAFSQIAGKAREYPKATIAAGAAVAAGVVAAATLGVRSRGRGKTSKD